MTKLNINRPIEIFDDRAKVGNLYPVNKVLFADDTHILAEIQYGDSPYKVFIDRSDNSVHSKLFSCSWYARNHETEATKKADEAIKYVKSSYISQPGKSECMLLGDVATLITKMTGVKVQTTDLLNL